MEITKPINLVDKKGNINFSWARKPIIYANIKDAKFNKNFCQLFGYGEGGLKTKEGKSYKIKNLIGKVENHKARW